MTPSSQCGRILAYLRRHRSVTQLEALNLFGCFRLAARVADLRGAGHSIKTVMVTNHGKRFARYWLRR